MTPFVFAPLLALAMACTDDGGGGGDGDDGPEANADYSVRGSIEQVYVWHTDPGTTLTLEDADGNVIAEGESDDFGGLVFREVLPGDGYRVTTDAGDTFSEDITVLAFEGSVPEQSFYEEQVLEPGFQYITMRDGTQLSVFVSLPGPPEDGPYPTLVNYSGYSPSKPGAPLSIGDLPIDSFCSSLPVLCDAPDHPSGLVGGVLGFATVGVNMRGTGCSGGAYDYFDKPQLTDGYDAIEIVAAQDWVKHGHVGMAGLSYPGISQLFVAAQQPPHLVAITPLSVIGSVNDTLVPGGILNNGFAIEWASNVLDDAEPYSGWTQDVVDAGDTVCDENQLLHAQKVDLIAKARANPYYDPEVAGQLDLNLYVDQIEVPVFLSGAWQDEQTGPGFTTILDKFDSTPVKRFTVFNGVHPDGYSPVNLTEWFNFLSFYVDREIPVVPDEVRVLAPFLFESQFGATTSLPEDRFGMYTDFDQALSDYESEPVLRAMFEAGNNPERPNGFPWGRWEQHYEQWPPETTEVARWYMHADGVLRDTAPTDTMAASSFIFNDDEGQTGNLPSGGDPWALEPSYDWKQPEPGQAMVWETEVLTETMVMLGTGSVDLWLQSTADDADLEVTISEVLPDGTEFYVQSGWLRASYRALSDESTELRPAKTYLSEDHAPLPANEWTSTRVEISAFGHPFRAGSKIRLYVDTPGGTRARWRFELADYPADTAFSVAHDQDYPSSVALPLVPDAQAPDGAPECPSLRGQPCRMAEAYANTPAG